MPVVARELSTWRVPAVTVKFAPVYVSAVFKMVVPVPFCVRPPRPLITLETVVVPA